MADVDAEGWKIVASELTSKVQIVGDDLFTTNIDRIRWGADLSLANAVLIKLNQIGTVSETLDAIRATHDAGWRPIVSARSGETEDAFICHLAVATNAGQIKVGSIARGERTAKWNELLRIERQLGERATYAGGPVMSAIGHPQRSQIIFSTM
jgi:enolase